MNVRPQPAVEEQQGSLFRILHRVFDVLAMKTALHHFADRHALADLRLAQPNIKQGVGIDLAAIPVFKPFNDVRYIFAGLLRLLGSIRTTNGFLFRLKALAFFANQSFELGVLFRE